MADFRIPRIETLIITVFFLGVGLWGINQCSAKRTQMVQKVQEFATNDEEEEDIPQKPVAAAPKPAPEKTPVPETSEPEPEAEPEAVKPKPKPGKRPELTNEIRTQEPEPTNTTASARKEGSTLYVTIEGLRMRGEPGLKGDPIAKLKLYEPVTFLNETTDWTQEINLGTEKVTDHWVKIRTQSGKEGWVFGAGLHYFKMKRKGVM